VRGKEQSKHRTRGYNVGFHENTRAMNSLPPNDQAKRCAVEKHIAGNKSLEPIVRMPREPRIEAAFSTDRISLPPSVAVRKDPDTCH
jgi:hypothetical protein